MAGGKSALIVTEMPYQVKRDGDDGVIKKIAELVNDKVIPEISDINNDSDRSGTRIRSSSSATPSQWSSSTSSTSTPLCRARSGSTWWRLWTAFRGCSTLREMIFHYLDHQKEVVTRRTKYQLDRAERQAHVLEGYLIALDNLDEVIELIRAAADVESARNGLIDRFGLSEIQAQAILEMRLRALTGLERKKVKDEHADLMELITELRAILADEDRLMALIAKS